MKLEKSDLKEIRLIVREEVDDVVEKKTRKIVQEEIGKSEKKLRNEIRDSENRVIATLSREITDLSEINRAVIDRVSKIDEMEKRIIRLEERVGITS